MYMSKIIKVKSRQHEYRNHYRHHAGLDGKLVLPYPQDMNAPIKEISFLGGLLHGCRREPLAA